MKPDDVRRIALALPESTEEPHFASASFRVKRKIFATLPPPGDHLHVFIPEEHREPALALHPRFLEKLLWGGKVWGVRVVLRKAKAAVVSDLLRTAWECKAPKRLRKTA